MLIHWQFLLQCFYNTVKSLQLCPTLCNPLDGSPPGSAVPGILQARTLEWAAISVYNAWKWSRLVMSDSLQPHGLQPPGSSVHGIFQARVLEGVPLPLVVVKWWLFPFLPLFISKLALFCNEIFCFVTFFLVSNFPWLGSLSLFRLASLSF